MSDMAAIAIILTVVVLIVLVPATIVKLAQGEAKKELLSVWLLVFAVSFVVVPVCLWMDSDGRPGPQRADPQPRPDDWRQRDNSGMAYIMMEKFVKERLKSPGSAKFPGLLDGQSDHVKPVGNHRYEISSWVDAQNAFGALMRCRFRGVIEQVSKDRWVLVSLALDDQ